MNIPSCLVNAKLIEPPNSIVYFCKSIKPEVKVLFYEDKNIQRSYRYFDDIFINIKGTYWFNYVSPPYGAETFGEVILLRILHELGHIQNKHNGSLVDNGATVEEIDDKEYIEKCEDEAWKWALEFRYYNQERYHELVNICTKFSETYDYECKNWLDDYKSQLKYLNDIDYENACLTIKKEKMEYFGELSKCPLNYKVIF